MHRAIFRFFFQNVSHKTETKTHITLIPAAFYLNIEDVWLQLKTIFVKSIYIWNNRKSIYHRHHYRSILF